ncbi:MAG: hypothetical protein U5P41_01645 [Gammaproteobacteria bacterium]|nr:hypothetical protein [Gammaproteobacteria bacterium]
MTYWPAEWCISFKRHCMPQRLLAPFVRPKLPRGARIVAFHGNPKPADAERGVWKGSLRWMRPTPWIADYRY